MWAKSKEEENNVVKPEILCVLIFESEERKIIRLAGIPIKMVLAMGRLNQRTCPEIRREVRYLPLVHRTNTKQRSLTFCRILINENKHATHVTAL